MGEIASGAEDHDRARLGNGLAREAFAKWIGSLLFTHESTGSKEPGQLRLIGTRSVSKNLEDTILLWRVADSLG